MSRNSNVMYEELAKAKNNSLIITQMRLWPQQLESLKKSSHLRWNSAIYHSILHGMLKKQKQNKETII